MSHPVRTCVGCRQQAGKRDLVRIVWCGDGVLPDPRQVAPGRGAYLHPDQTCVELAIKRRALSRALRLPGRPVDPEALRVALLPFLSPAQPPTSRYRGTVA